MLLYINIGLHKSTNYPTKGSKYLSQLQVEKVVASYLHGHLLYSEVEQSDSEPTLVVVVHCNARSSAQLRDDLTCISTSLSQDCIAVYYPDLRRGELYGKFRDTWGCFNPVYFLFPTTFCGTHVRNCVYQSPNAPHSKPVYHWQFLERDPNATHSFYVRALRGVVDDYGHVVPVITEGGALVG